MQKSITVGQDKLETSQHFCSYQQIPLVPQINKNCKLNEFKTQMTPFPPLHFAKTHASTPHNITALHLNWPSRSDALE